MESSKLIQAVDEMFMSFIRSEQYVSMNEQARNEFCDCIEQIRIILNKQPAEHNSPE